MAYQLPDKAINNLFNLLAEVQSNQEVIQSQLTELKKDVDYIKRNLNKQKVKALNQGERFLRTGTPVFEADKLKSIPL